MRTKIKRLTLILLISLIGLISLGGSVVKASAKAEFFGICILDESRPLEAFWGVTRAKDGSVHYSYKSDLVNTDICCWGHVSKSEITFSIVNDSKRPIEMNYLIDSYQLITHDRSLYKLKILTDIRYYPDVINPGEQNIVRASNPLEKRPEDIQYLLVDIDYDKVVIPVLPITIAPF